MSDDKRSTPLDVNILTDVYINSEINNREIADTPEETAGLASSIETTGGLLHRIIIYPTPPVRKASHPYAYELGSGYRRCAALKELAERTGDSSWVEVVPAEVREHDSVGQRHIEQLIENLQRRDLNPMETALAFKLALDDVDSHLTQSQLARAIGWNDSMVSTYLKAARNLPSEVQGMVISGDLSWSSARELASVIAKYGLDAETIKQLALTAVSGSHQDFLEHLQKTYGHGNEEHKDEEGKATTKKTGGSQRTYNAIRGSDLENKYIPKLAELAKDAKTPQEKHDLKIYEDALKFVLQMQGTELGAKLSLWEEELQEQELETRAQKELDRLRNKFIRSSVTTIKAKLKEIPPAMVDDKPNPNRSLMTLPQVLNMVKQAVVASLAKAKEEGLEPNRVIEGFFVNDVDAFITEINDAYVESANKDKENAARREKKKREDAEKAKAELENSKEAKEGSKATAGAGAGV